MSVAVRPHGVPIGGVGLGFEFPVEVALEFELKRTIALAATSRDKRVVRAPAERIHPVRRRSIPVEGEQRSQQPRAESPLNERIRGEVDTSDQVLEVRVPQDDPTVAVAVLNERRGRSRFLLSDLQYGLDIRARSRNDPLARQGGRHSY